MDGVQDQLCRTDAMQICLQTRLTALCNQEQQDFADSHLILILNTANLELCSG